VMFKDGDLLLSYQLLPSVSISLVGLLTSCLLCVAIVMSAWLVLIQYKDLLMYRL
jgi:hypothetical protein